MKKLKFHNPEGKFCVGSYMPTDNFKSHTHFAVMHSEEEYLQASVGLFLNYKDQKPSCFNDYLHYAECIEQGQLYANAHILFQMLSDIADGKSPDLEQINDVLEQITDISEPVNRLLGSKAMLVIEEALKGA